MKVLLPVDGSEASRATLAWAAQFLEPQYSELYLVYVIPWNIDALVHEEEIKEEEQILKLEQAFMESYGFKVTEAKYLLGAISEKICDYADEIGAEQIIIGSHGKTRLAKILMGSVSKNLFESARKPVLLLNNIAKPILEIASSDQVHLKQKGEYLKKVLLPVDDSESCQKTIEWAINFLDKKGSDIYLLNVIPYNPSFPPELEDFDQSKELLDNISHWFRQDGFQIKEALYMVGSVADSIIRFAGKRNINLIIIGSHRGLERAQYMPPGSVSRQVFENAGQPVILIRNNEKSTLKISHLEQVKIKQQENF